jgi:hypothetical protein
MTPHKRKRIKYTEINQPKNDKPKMRRCKLKSHVNWQGALKQKGIK